MRVQGPHLHAHMQRVTLAVCIFVKLSDKIMRVSPPNSRPSCRANGTRVLSDRWIPMCRRAMRMTKLMQVACVRCYVKSEVTCSFVLTTLLQDFVLTATLFSHKFLKIADLLLFFFFPGEPAKQGSQVFYWTMRTKKFLLRNFIVKRAAVRPAFYFRGIGIKAQITVYFKQSKHWQQNFYLQISQS